LTEDIRGRAIFISYRRDDTEGEAGRLFDDLVRAYGEESVFMDVTAIEPGLDFRKAIDANVASCGVLLAMIGPTWGSVSDAGGSRRLDNPTDFVRLEIASALARQIAVIPVLVHGAKMPPLDQLPDDLKDLRYRNSVELTHARWNSDVALLVTALKNYVTVNKSRETETVHATIPVQLPAPQPAPIDPPAKKSRLPLWIGIGAAALIVAAIAIFAVTRGSSSAAKPDAQLLSTAANSATPISAATDKPAIPQQVPDKPAAQPQATLPSAETALLGKWRAANATEDGDELTEISVVDFGGQIMVNAWGKCPDRLCVWGTRKASLKDGEAVTEVWELRNNDREIKQQRKARISLSPAGDRLQVNVLNEFFQPDGKIKQVVKQGNFEKVR
jgi:hypothetical protein